MMNVKLLKEMIENLPDDTEIVQETGDHDLFTPMINLTYIYDDDEYGLIEAHSGNADGRRAVIIR